MTSMREFVISRILCPIDFSDTSRHAIEHALVLSRWYRAAITALHVYPRLAPIHDLPVPEDQGPDADVPRLREQTSACFGAAAGVGIGVDVLVDAGAPAARILERASTLPADLIVMGTHGTSGFERLLIGSVTEKVLRKASCPVLTVPPRVHGASRLPFTRILCAVDFSESSLAALAAAFSLAAQSSAALVVVHALEWPWQEPPRPTFEGLPPAQAAALADFRRYQYTSALARLDSLIPDEARAKSMPTLRVTDGKSHVEILRAADEEHADLIVIGVRGRGQVDLALFGSTTNQVVRQARCPVLTLRADSRI